MPSEREACINYCNASFDNCQAAAEATYNQRLTQCDLMTDPAQRGQCKRDAAQVYAASLNACAGQHTTCVNACNAQYP